ncbi:MAG: pyruvate kinase [Chloroflexi bacterium]|nr:pyruvate kinase [Chloroflexota bacterium]
MRRTKIVCTIGPATRSPTMLRALMGAGMDVARLNFSHGTHAEHGETIRNIRQIAGELDARIAILQDLQGPKIRTGPLATGPVQLVDGAELTITTEPVPGSDRVVSTTYAELPGDVRPGSRLLLSDGSIELHVLAVTPTEVRTRVTRGGVLGEHTGINLPGVAVSAPALTEKDVRDLEFGIDQGVDFVAISFVRRAEDVLAAKQIIAAHGLRNQADIPVIAKLEKPEAIDTLAAIVETADGVMVARGDLGVEISLEKVPILQKRIIASANEAARPVITATQMLESMIHHPYPTRAEASDVANAILDGTDAVMLSGETAIGQYPVQAVEMMARIALEAERELENAPLRVRPRHDEGSVPHAIAEAAVTVAERLRAAAIISFTFTGFTALLVSKFRPSVPILAVTMSERVAWRTALYWGVTAQLVGQVATVDELLEQVGRTATRSHFIQDGDKVVVTASAPVTPAPGATNLLEIKKIRLR